MAAVLTPCAARAEVPADGPRFADISTTPAHPDVFPNISSTVGKDFRLAVQYMKADYYHAAVNGGLETSRLAPDTVWDGRGTFLAARAYAAQKDTDAALLLFRLTRQKYPVLGDYALYLSAKACREAGRHKEAAALYHSMSAEYPESVLVSECLLSAGEEYTELEQYAEAVVCLRELIDRRPEYNTAARARLLLMKACIALKDGRAALREYQTLRLDYPGTAQARQAEDLAARLAGLGYAPPEPGFDDYLHRAEKLYDRGAYRSAIAEYERAAGRLPEGSNLASGIYMREGNCRFRTKDYSGAEEAFSLALDAAVKTDDSADALYWLTRTYLRRGNADGFEAAALSLAMMYPKDSHADDTLYMLGAELVDGGRFDDALGVLKTLTQDYPDSQKADEALWQTGWALYQKGDYAGAKTAFDDITTRFKGSALVPQALYWGAKALEAAGDKDAATARYAALEDKYELTFYGLYAATGVKGGGGYPSTAPAPGFYGTDGNSSLERACELSIQGMRDEAVREMRRVEGRYGGSARGVRILAGMYGMAGEYRRPLLMAAQLYGEDDLARAAPEDISQLIYPLGYWDIVRKESEGFGLDPFLVSAVIREESRFDPCAVSGAGACGLMQLMPDTANAMCRRLEKERAVSLSDIKEDYNVPLGACYLKSLMDKHGGRLVYVLAEYNAGAEPLKRWVARRPEATDDEFIEGIGYQETRRYVKKVMKNYLMYRRLYGVEGAVGQP